MKLEFESNTASLPLVDEQDFSEIVSDSDSPEVTKMLRDGIKAAQDGNRAEARTLLLRVTEAVDKNENAWLWLASISEYPEELLVFLKNVLAINPNNERAIEWAKATESLMAKTFVQRGIDASKNDQASLAKQCFLQAIVHDNRSELAWLWLASVSDQPEEKMSHLQKVLSINPANENASSSLKNAKMQMAKSLMPKANQAAIAGKREESLKLLDEILHGAPEFEDGWMLKAHLAETFEEKIAYFEQVLEVNPDNQVARANLDSLKSIVDESNAQNNAESFDESEDVVEEFEQEQQTEEEAVAEVQQEYVEDDSQQMDLQEESEDFSEENVEQFEEHFEESSEVENFEVENSEYEQFKSEFEEHIESDSEVEEQSPSEYVEENFVEEDSVDYENVESNDEPQVSEEDFVSAEVDFEEVSEQPVDMEFSESDSEDEHNEMEANFEEESQTDHSEANFEEESQADHSMEKSNDEVELEVEANNSPVDEFDVSDSLEDDDEFDVSDSVEDDDEFEVSDSVEEAQDSFEAKQLETQDCPFCNAENEQKAFACNSCNAVLSLSDIEMLLSQESADTETINKAVEQMEVEKDKRGVVVEELKLMGVGYLNLKEYRKGFEYLQEALTKDPNDVMLSSQIDTLAIRISEIEAKNKELEAGPKCKSILVVDDSPTVRKLISGKLEKCGHEVISAVDGMDALAKINESVPDLVLLDITMPRMDGYQVCKLIRGNDATKDVPVVMISGKDGFFDKVRGKMAGTTNYITKPFGPETLMKTINEYLS